MVVTWDMITSGDEAGTLIHPLAYTSTEDDATRVQVWLWLATQLGSYLLRVNEGLDHKRILAPLTTDRERAQLVNELVLDHPRVVTAVDSSVVTDEDGITISIASTFTTLTGAELTLGATI